ncbi:NAD-dependent epimerase/dehydratase family protein [Pseudomonas berkeleyensis]|uniref:NAD-dependent epimerase/dehydratase family protein n=1 Tax=Pseudomonas berkeleyensis TaxID=2726956 RepID=A0A7G5DWA5_9PSED|nr:NAD-dependent epimerase/dehydratase family protein [Pseudomonas berkeleyensis]QMV66030.1 NAD-dependent epimerase/dehydratase family protein [Pseudomonas berkeleyensis]WSO41497.1 NAD-dependent epimerase/dehydratase family protein [Pseudomonas berkeleyensis]
MVTGANGHLGNTLVRQLLARGQPVRAGVRDPAHSYALQGLGCEVVRAELQDIDALRQSLQGVDVLYQVAAVFKHWAKSPQAEIIEPNVQGTRNILRAAAEAGVRRVVYVSSVAAEGHDGQYLDETVWNDEQRNPYYLSKILSERAAWEAAQAYGISMVTVLPSAIIGPHAERLTDTMGFLAAVLVRKLVLDPDFHFNFVDVRDVADGLIQAAERGRPGQRYILANRESSSLGEVIAALDTLRPGQRLPARAPKVLLLSVAMLQMWRARLTGQPAELLPSQVRMFHGVRQRYCIDKAVDELGYRPRPPQEALRQAFEYLLTR